jgi:hypothetical protein
MAREAAQRPGGAHVPQAHGVVARGREELRTTRAELDRGDLAQRPAEGLQADGGAQVPEAHGGVLGC